MTPFDRHLQAVQGLPDLDVPLDAVCGIQRCHLMTDLFRNRRVGFVDEVGLARQEKSLHNPAGGHSDDGRLRQLRALSGTGLTANTTRYKLYELKGAGLARGVKCVS